ncbi:hypothetical protein BH23VER1_BH23VER1_19960 [soil metagenome]
MNPRALRDAYRRGENVSRLLREESGTDENSEEAIETAYDLQAGSYIAALENPDYRAHKLAFCGALADLITGLGGASSLLETGVGEATTLGHLIEALPGGAHATACHGFDLSWSRIATARRWLDGRGITDVALSVASLLEIPYADSSFDVVYTAHTIEPNGGRERAILTELHRVTSRYLILLEPGYELAGPEAQARMREHGYCRDLPGHARALGMVVIRHELFPHSAAPLNPTALTVIAKVPGAAPATPALRCPRYHYPLARLDDCYYSEDSMRCYPIIGGIPCIRSHQGVIASQRL